MIQTITLSLGYPQAKSQVEVAKRAADEAAGAAQLCLQPQPAAPAAVLCGSDSTHSPQDSPHDGREIFNVKQLPRIRTSSVVPSGGAAPVPMPRYS